MYTHTPLSTSFACDISIAVLFNCYSPWAWYARFEVVADAVHAQLNGTQQSKVGIFRLHTNRSSPEITAATRWPPDGSVQFWYGGSVACHFGRLSMPVYGYYGHLICEMQLPGEILSHCFLHEMYHRVTPAYVPPAMDDHGRFCFFLFFFFWSTFFFINEFSSLFDVKHLLHCGNWFNVSRTIEWGNGMEWNGLFESIFSWANDDYFDAIFWAYNFVTRSIPSHNWQILISY